MNNSLVAGQIIKTKAGTKTWEVVKVLSNEIHLSGETNAKPKTITIEQFNKSWQIQ